MTKRIILPIISAVLLTLSFPDFNFEGLAWFGFVPLFFAIENKRPFKAFLISYIAGVLFFLGTIYWLIHVTLPGMIIIVLYLAVYFGLFGLACNSFFRSVNYDSGSIKRLHLLLSIPAVWVALELVRSHFITGFGWALLGYSQSFTLPVIQIADYTGVYGVSFLIVFVNAAIFLTIKEIRKKDYKLTSLMLATILLFAVLYYGVMRTRNVFTGNTLKVAVVQGNIPQAKKWDPSFKKDILDKYEHLTRLAVARNPELIIWPETSVPGFMESEPELLTRVTKLAKDIGVPILVGTPREDPGRMEAYYNSAVLIDSVGDVVSRYDKMHLVPFGEYVPLRKLFAFVENFAPSPIGDFSAGKEYTVFEVFVKKSARDKDGVWHSAKKARFATLICFEDIFPGLARKFVAGGANFLVNMTNDAWFWKTSAAYQHAESSIFRAVENRVNVIRAANTGVSCFIDQKGEIIDSVLSGGESVFVDGFAVHEITLTRTKTFYTLYGDVFAYMCVLITIGYILLLKRKKWHI